MAYDPPTTQPPDPSYALRTFRRALSARSYKPVDILLVGDSLTEGYYVSNDVNRWSNLFRQGMQRTFNPPGVPGGEGFVGGYHTVAIAPPGSTALPQRWTLVGSPSLTDNGFGLGRRNFNLNAATKYGIIQFYGDRVWFHYTTGGLAGWVGLAVDGKTSTVSTLGALNGTGVGTFNVADPEGWPTGSFVVTVDDEDILVSQGTGANSTQFTIPASGRAQNGTTAVAHATASVPVAYAPAGVQRLNTYNAAPPRSCGRQWDSGQLARGSHTLTVYPISKTGAGGNTYNVYVDGITVFDGDGAASPATFTDGTPITTTITSGSNNVNVNTLTGAGTINITSNANFPTPTGTAAVQTASGYALVTYTGTTGTTLTGCQVLAATLTTVAAGLMATGGIVASQHFDSATAKFVSLDTNQQFRAPNLSGGNVVISSVISGTRVKLSLPPTGAGTAQTFSIGGRGAGVRVWEGGHAGHQASHYGGPAATINGYWADALDVTDPDLVIIEFAVNDAQQGGMTEATFVTNMTNIVTLVNSKSAVPPSIVFFVPWVPTGYVTQTNFQPYIDGIYKVAAATGAAVFDANSHIIPQTPGDVLADGVHPTDLGAGQIALELQKFLIGADVADPPVRPSSDWSLALKAWRQGVSMTAVRPCDVVFLGDSITEGYYASADSARYPNLIRQRLQALYNPPGVVGGEGYIPAVHTVGYFINSATAPAPTGYTNLAQRWTIANSGQAFNPQTNNGYGLGRRAWFYSSGATSTATITVYCDRFLILYTTFPTAAALNVTIDSVLQTNQPSCLTAQTQSGRQWDSGPLTLGNHTIVVNSSAAGGIVLDGIMVFVGDGGDITLNDATTTSGTASLTSYKAYFTARDAGRTISSPANTPVPTATTILKVNSSTNVTLSNNAAATTTTGTFTISGRGSGIRVWEAGLAGATTLYYNGASPSQSYWVDPLDLIDPDLVFIQLGPNDSNITSGAYVDPASFQTNLISMINLIRLKCPSPGPSIVLIAGWVSGLITPQQWQPYRDAIGRVATNMGCAVLDLSAKIGPGPASGYTEMFSDVLHLTDAGEIASSNEHLLGLGILDRGPNIPYSTGAPTNPTVGQMWVDTSVTPSSQDDLAVFGSDGALTTKTGAGRYRFPYAITVVGVTAAVNTAPTGLPIICDVNKNGTTIFTTQGNRPTIAVSANATTTSPTPDVTALAAGDYLTVDIDQVGSTIAGSDLTVTVQYRRS